MNKCIPLTAAAVLVSLSAGTAGVLSVDNAAAHPRPGTATLEGSAAAMTRNAVSSKKVAASKKLTIQVWMTDHQPAAQRFVTAVSTPGSSRYRQFLSPDAYTKKFGPASQQVAAVRSFLTGRGFTNVSASTNHDYVAATGSVATINRTFSVQMRRYETGGTAHQSGMIETNNRALTVPAAIRPAILAVTGLDSSRPKADTAAASPGTSTSNCSQYWAQHTTSFSPAYHGLTRAANAVCGYSAQQIRGAYGLTSSDTGAGTRIALIQLGAPNRMRTALTDYAKRNGLPTPEHGQYREEHITQGPHTGCLDTALEEAALDSEATYAIAPRAHQLMVDGNDCDSNDFGNQALFDAELAPITGHRAHPQVNIESRSYGLSGAANERVAPRSDLLANHAILLRAAAEGVSVLDASGDHPGLEPPDADPDSTVVGGTTLGVGADHQRVFETGWSTDFGERTNTGNPWYDAGTELGGSGGTSVLYREPSYQDRAVPNSVTHASNGHDERVIPDLSADGDPYTGMLLGEIAPSKHGGYSPFKQAGTSLSAPLIAGMVADAEQGHDLGFLDPFLYSLDGTRAFHDVLPVTAATPQTDQAFIAPGDTDIKGIFHLGTILGRNDTQSNGTEQTTTTGYDTMTGLGSPNGPAFIAALRSAK